MKNFNQLCYTDKIRWRIRALWALVAVMLIYMVIVGETGGDSRMMTELAQFTSRVIFFGGFIYIVCRIIYNKRLLRDRLRLKEQMQLELDERKQSLHEKSGGIVLDILLVLLLFTTLTASLFNMAAFHLSITILLATAFFKCLAYFIYSHRA